MADEHRPVIASSNRFDDILPYSALLFEEASKRWGAIMPWQFPQNATQDSEEAFLREQFPAVEIQVQGFRFLKQVWLCIALNNFQNRVPHVQKEWFEQKGPDYLNDPTFSVHLLNPAARAHTFFEASEIELYGSDFLDVVVTTIQHDLRNSQQYNASSASPSLPAASVATNTAGVLELDQASQPQVAQPDDRSQLHSRKETTPTSTIPTKVLKPTATVFSSSNMNTPVQSTATLESASHRRSCSGQTQPTPSRVLSHNARGPAGTHNYSQNPTGSEPPQATHYSRFASSKTHHQSRQQTQMPPVSMMPQFATRGPSTFQSLAPGHLPQPQSDFSHPQAPPGFQSHHSHRMQMNDHNAFAPNRSPYGYGPPQVSERTLNTAKFVNQAGHGSYDPESERSQTKRRESNASYGGKGGTFPLSRGRGRGGRGRNSVGQSSIDEAHHFWRRHPSGTSNEIVAFSKQFDDRHFSANNRHTQMYGSSRSSKHDENTTPYSHHPEHFPHGPTQILHDPRRTSQALAGSGNMQRLTSMPSLNPAGQYTVAPSHADNRDPSAFSTASGQSGIPLPEFGCTKTSIGPKCLYAKKLIAFGIGESASHADIVACFSQFGPVGEVHGPFVTQSLKGVYSRTYITFITADGARNCIEQPSLLFREQPISVSVAREFWDPAHKDFQPRSAWGISPGDLKNTVPSSMQYIQTSAINPPLPLQAPTAAHHEHSSSRATEPIRKEVTSTNTNEPVTAAVPGTPKSRKRPGNNSKKNNAKNTGRHEDSVSKPSEEDAQNSRLALRSIPDDASSCAEPVVLSNTTPMKRSDSLRSGVPDSLQAAQGMLLEHTVQTSLTAPESEVKPMPASSETLKTETADAKSRPEEEHVDDSFHTASVISDDGPREHTDAEIVSDTAAAIEEQTPLQPTLESTFDEKSAAEHVESAEVATQAQAETQSLNKDYGSVDAVTLPTTKPEILITLPQLDTSSPPTTTASNSDPRMKIARQRTASGSSDRPSAYFVTAPNTPSSPGLGQAASGEPQSRKEARAKEEAKAKGPAQTESYSQFSKPKKAKKAKASKGNSRATSRVSSAELPKPDQLPTRKVTTNLRPASITEQPEVIAETDVCSEMLKSPSECTDAVELHEPAATEVRRDDVVSDSPEIVAAASVDSPAGPSILRRFTGLTNIFSTGTDLQASVDAEGDHKADAALSIDSQPADEVIAHAAALHDPCTHSVQLPVSAAESASVLDVAANDPSLDGDAVDPSKKSKKKKKKAKKSGTHDVSVITTNSGDADQPKATVLEMGHHAPSNEISTLLNEFEGTDSEMTASRITATGEQECEQADCTSLGKVNPLRRLESDNHLVQAALSSRRVSSDVKHSAKKSSDSSDTLNSDTIAITGPQSLAEICEQNNVCTIITLPVGYSLVGVNMVENNDGQGRALKLYILYTEPDAVEASRMRILDMDRQERDIKHKKQLAVHGHVLGEVKDEDEDEGHRGPLTTME